MSETLFAPTAKKPRRKSHEHSFQSWVDRFIDRVVVPPVFTTGIDHAASDMANIGRRMSVRGRGVKYGIPDVFVAQREGVKRHSVWIELKRGSTVTETQAGVHRAMTDAGQHVSVCRTMPQVLEALRASDFLLHGNADNLATEYEARVEAARQAPSKKRRASRPAKPKYNGKGITSSMLIGRGR